MARPKIHRPKQTRRLVKITSRAVALFKRALPMNEKHIAEVEDRITLTDDEHAEMIAAINAFHHEINQKPWEPSPLDVDGPDDMYDPEAWRRAQELRRELEKACRGDEKIEPGK